MENSAGLDHEPRPPRLAEVLTLLLVVQVVAALARWTGRWTGGSADASVTLTTYNLIVFAASGLIGLPVLVWVLERGRQRLAQFVGPGAAVGVIPMGLVLISGILGRYYFGGMDHVRWFLAHGAPIPTLGPIPWPEFLLIEAKAAAIGATSAGIYWRLFIAAPRQRSNVG